MTLAERLIKEGEKRGELRGEKRGELRGELRGERRGEKRGLLRGELRSLKKLRRQGLMDEETYQKMAKPLIEKLAKLGFPE